MSNEICTSIFPLFFCAFQLWTNGEIYYILAPTTGLVYHFSQLFRLGWLTSSHGICSSCLYDLLYKVCTLASLTVLGLYMVPLLYLAYIVNVCTSCLHCLLDPPECSTALPGTFHFPVLVIVMPDSRVATGGPPCTAPALCGIQTSCSWTSTVYLSSSVLGLQKSDSSAVNNSLQSALPDSEVDGAGLPYIRINRHRYEFYWPYGEHGEQLFQ